MRIVKIVLIKKEVLNIQVTYRTGINKLNNVNVMGTLSAFTSKLVLLFLGKMIPSNTLTMIIYLLPIVSFKQISCKKVA